MEANVSMLTLSESGGLSLVISLEGSATVATLSGNGVVLSLTIGPGRNRAGQFVPAWPRPR